MANNSSDELHNLLLQSHDNSGRAIQELSLQLALEKREKAKLEDLVTKQEGTIAKLHEEIRTLYKESGRFEEKIEVFIKHNLGYVLGFDFGEQVYKQTEFKLCSIYR